MVEQLAVKQTADAITNFEIFVVYSMCIPKKKDKRIYADRAEYLKKAVARRRKYLRLVAIRLKGKKCVICGYEKCFNALEFHHRNPNTKEFGISMRGLTRSWMRVRKELTKCELLCTNCHREVHAGISQLPKAT